MAPNTHAFEGDLNALPVPCVSLTALRNAQSEVIDFTLDQANSAFFELVAVPAESLIGMRLSNFLSNRKDKGPDWIDFNRSVLEANTTQELVSYIPGFNQWLRILAKANGLNSIVTVIENVTGQKQAEADLRESREEFKNILSNIHDVIYSAKYPDFSVDFVSESVLRNTGYPPEYFIGQRQNWLDIVLPEDMVLVERGEQELRETGRTRIEYRFRHADESVRTVLENAHIVFDKSGQPLRMEGIVRDITEQRKLTAAQDLLVKMAKRFINIPAENGPAEIQSALAEMGQTLGADRVYIFDYDFEAETASNTYEWCDEGIEPEIEVLQNLPFSFNPYWVEAHMNGRELGVPKVLALDEDDPFRQMLEPQGILSLLTLPLMKNGRAIGFVGFDWVKQEHQYDELELNALVVFAELLVNLSIRIESVKQIEAARHAAEAASRSKSEFLANMSHEIRTPLNGVIGFAELLLDTPLNDIQVSYARNVNVSGKSLLGIVNDILDFSKIEAGKLDLECITTDLLDLLDETVDIVRYNASAKGLRFVYKPNPSLPEFISIDPLRFKQVLVNLLGNAIKFTESGEVELSAVFHEQGKRQGVLECVIRDTGMGIASDHIGRLFTAFAQADESTTRKFGGTGLGLAISKLLVEKMGGNISVQSVVHQGSSFTVRVPIRDYAPPKRHSNLPFKRILLAESHLDSAHILRDTLEFAGVEVVLANSADAVVQALEKDPPELLVIEDDLDGGNRLEIIRKIRRDMNIGRRQLPIMLLHANISADEVSERCMEYEVCFSIAKPVKPTEIVENFYEIARRRAEMDARHAEQTDGQSSKNSEEVMHILLVEDVELNLTLVKVLLAKFTRPVEVSVARNGQEAIEAFKTKTFDLVLMDIQMPVLDGIQATREIRAWEVDKNLEPTPILALTAGALVEEHQRALAAGMDAFLTKPIDRVKLYEMLNQFLPKLTTPTEIFDEAALRAMMRDDESVLRELFSIALSDLPKRVQEVVTAGAENNRERLILASHALAGAALSLKFNKLGETARKIEHHPKDAISQPALIEELQRDWLEVEKILSKMN